MLIDQFAPNILLLDYSANNDFNGLERPSRSHRRLMLSSTRNVRENSLGSRLSSLVAQHNPDLAGVGPDLLEGRIADDFADGAFVAEGPFALVGVREGDVRVGTAL